MALAIDGFKVLRKIAENADLFADIRTDATKSAQAFVEKKLKAKSTDIQVLRRICDELGRENFGLVVEGMKDGPINTLVSKLDKFHPEMKGSDGPWRRRHLMALATGETGATAKPVPVKKAKKTSSRGTKGAAPERLSSEVFEALKRRG